MSNKSNNGTNKIYEILVDIVGVVMMTTCILCASTGLFLIGTMIAKIVEG